MFKKLNDSGFSLLELSIVLVVVSIMLGSGIAVFNKYIAQSKVEETEAKMRIVMTAIKKYAIKNNRLPCPADGSDLVTDASFGVGTYSSGCTTENYASGDTASGMVPVTTLGIYPSLAVDAWGNRFTYILSDQDTAAPNGVETYGGTYLSVRNNSSNAASAISDVVVLLISHGANGYGAWNGRGGSRKDPTGGINREDQNADSTLAGPFITSATTRGYDDITYFWTFYQIDPDSTFAIQYME